MSFRNEEKILTTLYQQGILLNDFIKLGATLLYPTRNISSVYFDTKNLQMFNDSEESILPRKKIRIRNYDNNFNESNLEIKISSPEGKFKRSQKIDKNLRKKYLEKGYLDSTYGYCQPVIKVTYNRTYYKLNQLRITFDKDINYENFISKNSVKEKMSVVELKSQSSDELIKIDKLLSLSRQRFSKYSRGCIELNIK